MTKEKSISIVIAVFATVLVLMMSTGTASAKIVKKNVECTPGQFQVTFDTKTGTITKGKLVPVANEKSLENWEIEEKYCGMQSVVIPSKIAGVKVEALGKRCFIGCTNLKSVKLPKTLKRIGVESMAGCDEIHELIIPERVEKIGARGLNGIGVSTITIPKSVKTIGKDAIVIYSLKSIKASSGSKYFTSSNGVLFNKDKTKIIAYPAGRDQKEYTVPDTIKSLGYHQVAPSRIQKLHISKNLTAIGAGALSEYDFKYFTVSSKNRKYMSSKGVIYNKEKTKLLRYPNGNEKKSYTVPKSVTTIAYPAIAYANLRAINIPSSVKKIEKDAIHSPYTTVYCKKGSAAAKYCKKNKQGYVTSLKKPDIGAYGARGEDRFVLAWTGVKGATRYEVYRYSKKEGKFVKVKTTSKKKMVVYREKNKTYRYKVRAYHSIGSEKIYSPFSDIMKIEKA